MIGWYTDNPLSRTVMEAVAEGRTKQCKPFVASHISGFSSKALDFEGLFYGILRGTSRLMHIFHYLGRDFYYIDNGYFDALYVDKSMQKSMEGKFRVVKNGMHEICPYEGKKAQVKKILIIPPSSYSANFYDTTPEDWLAGKQGRIRTKSSTKTIEDDLAWCDGVLSFNSMVVMKAIEMGKSVMDTHGIFRTKDFHTYDIADLRDFYEPKQFTLQEFKEGKWQPT